MRTRIALTLFLMTTAPVLALAADRTGTPAIVTASAASKGVTPGAHKQPVPPFNKVDRNGDHEIEWKEAKAAGVPKAVFERYDYHHDGKLTITEWKMVKVAMIKTVKLPTTGSSSLPKIPADVVKKIHAPAYGTVTGTAIVPAPSTGSHGGG